MKNLVRLAGRRRLLFPVLILPILVALSCGETPGERAANRRPLVQIAPRPAATGRLGYATTFYWTGFDMDGFVDHYQYAIDVPDSVGLVEINDPGRAGIAWRDTTATGATFFFSTPGADSARGSDSVMVFTGVYVGRHTLYVRAVDNEGAVSDADYVVFTAENVMPKTQLGPPRTMPSPFHWIYYVRNTAAVWWTGEDPDCPGGPCAPAYYEWKLVPGINPFAVTDPGRILRQSPAPWNRLPEDPDTASLRLTLNPPEDYLLGVRAVDRGGAVEDLFRFGQNAVVLAASAGNGIPVFVVRENSLGTFTFPTGEDFVAEVAAGHCLTFHFTADAEAYGGVIQAYNWGVDVEDVENDAEFHGWSTYPGAQDPVCIQSAGWHNFVVKVRDTTGSVTIGTILLGVVDFPRDREVLYLDDFRLSASGAVDDAMMDARARAMLVAAGYAGSDIHQIDTFGPGDAGMEPEAISLAALARYKLVVWSNWAVGYAGRSALVTANACPTGRVLQAYVAAGGAAWIHGQQVFGSFKAASYTSCTATVGYDENNALNFAGTEFPVRFLGLAGAAFRNVKASARLNGMVRGNPTAEASLELFPPVELDSTIYDPGLGGIPSVDALFTPTYSVGLDTLYRMETSKPGSAFRNKPIAFRYLNPDPGSTQGPVAVFGFPFHLLKQGSGTDRTGVEGMARSMIEWFRSHGG